jgi:hypothetical protein
MIGPLDVIDYDIEPMDYTSSHLSRQIRALRRLTGEEMNHERNERGEKKENASPLMDADKR